MRSPMWPAWWRAGRRRATWLGGTGSGRRASHGRASSASTTSSSIIAVGIILGGRAGYVLFYNLPFFLANPAEIPKLWTGGMAFHGGLVGAVLGLWLFARRNKVPVLTRRRRGGGRRAVRPAVRPPRQLHQAGAVGPGQLMYPGPWCFPAPARLPRHPSQLYEAALEGRRAAAGSGFRIRARRRCAGRAGDRPVRRSATGWPASRPNSSASRTRSSASCSAEPRWACCCRCRSSR